MLKNQVLGVLEQHRDRYVSGEELASTLSVSRSAVWKAVRALRAEGYGIASTTNRGYMLGGENDMLSAEGIRKYLDDPAGKLSVTVYKALPSTNQTAKELAADGAAEPTLVVAGQQTAGHGRKGRNFYSPADTGVYFSLLLRPGTQAEQAAGITTAAAVAVCEAIEALSDLKPKIKWVNDIFLNGKKVCGILSEASVDLESGGLEYAVLGIGVNVYSPASGFPAELEPIVGAVFDRRQGDMKNRLVAEIVNRFMKLYANRQPETVAEAYRLRCMVIGKTVHFVQNGNPKTALVLDVDDRCHLNVRYENGETACLSSGEISLGSGAFSG